MKLPATFLALFSKLYPLDIEAILLRLKYSKSELEIFRPDYRYIPFNRSKELISEQTGGMDSDHADWRLSDLRQRIRPAR